MVIPYLNEVQINLSALLECVVRNIASCDILNREDILLPSNQNFWSKIVYSYRQ